MTLRDEIIAIDFGTTHTAAAVGDGTSARAVPLGDGGLVAMPSCAFLDDDGSLLVGSPAENKALLAIDRFIDSPKRSLGETEVMLGDTTVEVVEVIAAVLREAGERARALAPQATTVRLTHPAGWRANRRDVLRQAGERAGLGRAETLELVAEPVAAALQAGAGGLAPGAHIAVYDFGGGTFDAAVLRVIPGGVELAGPPQGRDPLGGEDIDQRIIDHLAAALSGEEGWERLMDPADPEDRVAARLLRQQVRQTKEILSRKPHSGVLIPLLRRTYQLTQVELEELVRPDLEDTMDVLAQAIARAGLSRVDRIVLTGGSSRIPLVAAMVWQRFELQPVLADDPKLLVALGATRRLGTARRMVQVAASPELSSTGSTLSWRRPEPAGVRSRLAAATHSHLWPLGADGFGYLTLEGPSGETVRVADAPAETEDLAAFDQAMRDVLVRHHGGQLRLGATVPAAFLGRPAFHLDFSVAGEPMMQRYLVDQGRTVMVTAPARAAPLVDRLQLGPALSNPRLMYELRVELPGQDPGWRYSERLVLVRRGNRTTVTCRSLPVVEGSDMEWTDAAAREVGARPGHVLQSRRLGTFLGGRPCVEYGFRAADPAGAMLTRLRAAVIDGRGYSIVVSMRPIDRLGYGVLLRGIVLRGE